MIAITLINITGRTGSKKYTKDLTVKLYWDTGTLPPEYYYYYRIIIGPEYTGIFEYQPGYGESTAPDAWKVNFKVSQDQLDYLYKLLIENNLFKDEWEKTEIAYGGSFSSITIISGGREYKIPRNAELKKEDIAKIDIVSDYLKEIVPADIWKEMNKRQIQFEESFTDE
ncbi:MAG: hypothetical protein ACYDIA_13705 [Candidatus Humimicrobiaceae bacterium]